MSALAAAPLPVVIALTVLALGFLLVIAKAAFAAIDEPARRLCAILATLRRQRAGVEVWHDILSAPPSPAPDCRTPADARLVAEAPISDIPQRGASPVADGRREQSVA
jgi:hypothetical protein